jgi:signal transduction histidine kinase
MSLVTLGTLAAGIAHEINNPAAAASRAVQTLDTQCQTLLSSVRLLAEQRITPEQFAALDRLRGEIKPGTAAPLAAAGVDQDWCARAAAVLDESALEPGLEWVASTLSVATLLSEVKESTRRISELVAAVRSYTQMDRASMQHLDVTDGLDSTLVMLAHRLRGVTVVRQYGPDVPMIDAYAGELNQVWTNVIENAVDAMGGSGTLRVTTRVEDDDVVIEIGDTGVGMSPEVAARAFEAFYTTKDVGKGTGLGLDIARRIVVERHGGAIMIDSRPGETVVRVRLPARQS